MSKNKTAVAIALFLMFAMTFSLVASPAANAQSETDVATYAFISVSPDPDGVGQPLFIVMWILPFNPTSGANLENVWHDYTLTITKPSGTTETKVQDANAAASVAFQYTPDQTGNWTFKFTFPGEQVGETYFKSSSSTTSVTVQDEPLTPLPQNPLPLEYWQRPIEWQNQLWSSISGNWFGDIPLWENTQAHFPAEGYNPDTTAPQTAHIVWTKPLTFGGQIGGEMYSANDLSNYYTGKSYESFFVPPVIIQGVLYYNKPEGIKPYNGVTAVDLRTGQELWHRDDIPHIDFGEVFSHHNPNEVGGIAYLWGVSGSTLSLYDATTGDKILTITGVHSSKFSKVLSPTGELLVYDLQPINSTYAYLSMWNSTKCIGGSRLDSSWQWRPSTGATLSYKGGIQFNATVPIYPQTGTSVSINCVNDGVVLVIGAANPQSSQMEAGYSAETGELLWHVNRDLGMTPARPEALMEATANGVYTEHNKEAGTYYGFDIHTGAKLWGPTAADTNPWNSYTRQAIGDDQIFMMQGPATTRAYDAKTGEFLWEFVGPPAGLQESTPTYIFEGTYTLTVGGGDMFLGSANSHGDQLFRGARLYAINTTTGEADWDIAGFYSGGHTGGNAIADGCLVAYNAYDCQIYTFGKGLSATTVSAPDTVQTLGTQVLVQGTVTDQSPGQTCLGIPAAGTPAVADEYMTPWMEYLYMQQPKPSNATGVKVTISVLDPNKNVYDVGTTTSDASGMYKLTFTPPVSGEYTVIASFAGSGSYYSSYAETALAVNEVPAATPTPTPTPASMADLYFVPMSVATIIAVIVIGALLILMLRKR